MLGKTKERILFEKIKRFKHDSDVGFLTAYLEDGLIIRLDYINNKTYNNIESAGSRGINLSLYLIEKKVSHARTDNHGGYYLQLTHRGTSIRLHRLVAYHKYGSDIFGMEVDHLDGNRENNNPKNLNLVNSKQNSENAVKRGAFKGMGSFKGKIKKKDLLDILDLISGGVMLKDIAVMYSVDPSCVSLIKSGKWRGLGSL